MGRRSGWDDWDSYRARRPANGIKAVTQRGKFGATWWAGRWLAALEQVVDAGRLSRGRSYARSGQVTRLDAGSGGVDASVQGSQPRPYRVSIQFETLSDDQWEAVIDAMAAQAIFAARLLSGEMPEQIEEAFETTGVTLFPSTSGDLETGCSCPDLTNPCKHVAAVFYLLGERFDADPFLMFQLRGRTREQIIEGLRQRRTGAGETATDAASSSMPGDTAPGKPEKAEDVQPLPVTESFWSFSSALPEQALAYQAPPVDALPIKMLGAPPFWQEWPDFIGEAEQAYRAIGERARRIATGEDSRAPKTPGQAHR